IFIEGFTNLELGKKYFIQSPDEVDEVVNRILSDLEECVRVKGFLHLDENKVEVNSEKPLLLLLYNLLKALGIRNVTLD
ncbi:molybdopterin-guanine dinucleotide biosynthesis protein B, partial [Sulfolobus sp. E1]